MGAENNPQYRKQGEPTQSPREGGRDYAAMFQYIRVDKDTQSFIADLRDNKEQLASLFGRIREDYDYKDWKGTLGYKDEVAKYLSIVLEEHVFDMDPYRELPPTEHFLNISVNATQRQKRRWDSNFIGSFADSWLEGHPDSEAAKAVSVLGINAPRESQHKLLQEMWPTFLPKFTD
jgi:hypothetical protein